MTPANTLKGMSMTALIGLYNELAVKAGALTVTEFKSLAFARSEITNLETKMETPENTPQAETTTADATVAGTVAAPATKSADAAKYDSTGKRGPNQGVGAFAKEQLLLGKNNSDVLAAVTEKFPGAKTSKGCIAFYRTALQRDGKLAKGGGAIPQDPVAMEAAADKLIADAQALKVKAGEERAKLEAAAAAQVPVPDVAVV